MQWIDVTMSDGNGDVVAGAHALRVERTEAPRYDVGAKAEPPGVTMPELPAALENVPLGLPGLLGFWRATELRLLSRQLLDFDTQLSGLNEGRALKLRDEFVSTSIQYLEKLGSEAIRDKRLALEIGEVPHAGPDRRVRHLQQQRIQHHDP